MAQRSRKHRDEAVRQIHLVLNGGVNYAQPKTAIADNELLRAYNFLYDADTEKLVTRPGTVCQTKETHKLDNAILKLFCYEKDTDTVYLVCASGGKLYYLSGVSLDEWTEIGNLTDGGTVPSMLTFNGKLLIADGGTAVRTWDGTTYTTIAGSPKATALMEIKNRVVANDKDDPDAVFFSAVEDENTWSGGTAVSVRCGYGDMLAINCFAVGPGGNDLIVSKVGEASRRIYRINLEESDPSLWYSMPLSVNNAAQNNSSIVTAFNEVFFIDSNGFKSLAGVVSYGDINVDMVGKRVNNLFVDHPSVDDFAFLSTLNALWGLMSTGRVFCLHIINEQPVFTDISFKWGRARSICEVGGTVYLGGNDGYLRKLVNSVSTDEISPGATESYVSTVRTKDFSYTGKLLVRRFQVELSPLLSGQAHLYFMVDDEAKEFKEITLMDARDFLYDATYELYSATWTLYEASRSTWIDATRSKTRGKRIGFQMMTTSGRVYVDSVTAEFVLVEG